MDGKTIASAWNSGDFLTPRILAEVKYTTTIDGGKRECFGRDDLPRHPL